MTKAITESTVSEWESLQRKAAKLEDTITERIDYILRAVFKTFGGDLHYWYFDGAGEGEVGDLSKWMDDNEISAIWTEAAKKTTSDMIIIDKFGNEWEYDSAIPTRWLYDNEFEVELHNGKLQYEEKEKARKAKQKELTAAKKAEDAALIEEAKKKLTKKELAALRRSI
jgi:hypothetical protein